MNSGAGKFGVGVVNGHPRCSDWMFIEDNCPEASDTIEVVQPFSDARKLRSARLPDANAHTTVPGQRLCLARIDLNRWFDDAETLLLSRVPCCGVKGDGVVKGAGRRAQRPKFWRTTGRHWFASPAGFRLLPGK
jgi:hypothetical protein